MDMYGSSYQPNPNQPYRSRRSARMEAASLILGSIALLAAPVCILLCRVGRWRLFLQHFPAEA